MNRLSTFATAAAVLTVACGSADNAANGSAGQPVGLLDYVTTAPVEWVPTPTASTMRLAEFTTPVSGDLAEAEVVAYYFGPGQGGSVEANTARWAEQFFNDAGGHPDPSIAVLNEAQFPTTVVTLEGSYARAIGMGGEPADAVPDQMLVAAVVETPDGNFYIQLHGPIGTVLEQRDAFLAFVGRIHPRIAADQTS